MLRQQSITGRTRANRGLGNRSYRGRCRSGNSGNGNGMSALCVKGGERRLARGDGYQSLTRFLLPLVRAGYIWRSPFVIFVKDVYNVFLSAIDVRGMNTHSVVVMMTSDMRL